MVLAEAHGQGLPLLFGQVCVDLLRAPEPEAAAWVDFETRSAEYYGLLAELSGTGPDRDAAEGFLPSTIADRVRGLRLDDSRLRVSLRGYQSFGARFALAQKRVVLGDEMGLGKTVQAIAALAHLAAGGARHFLVVCPASVFINWTREIRARSTLEVLPVHGPDRLDAFAEWRHSGGVALTTFDALHALPDGDAAGVRPTMVVVDEAHYVKNPATRRSRAVAGWTDRAEHVLFLTGTPMENRVAEFRSLIRLLRPELAPPVDPTHGAAGSHAFRRAVAPAYLRRNQEDVLTELPALVRADEWVEFSEADLRAYRAAVDDGHFMRMRRAAYAVPEASAKLARLRELVAEAAGNGHKVVVFSYFREVLATVRAALGDAVFGPVAGDVAAARSAGSGGRLRGGARSCGAAEPDPGGRHRAEHAGRFGGHPLRTADQAHPGAPGRGPRAPHGADTHRPGAPVAHGGQCRPADDGAAGPQGPGLRRLRAAQ